MRQLALALLAAGLAACGGGGGGAPTSTATDSVSAATAAAPAGSLAGVLGVPLEGDQPKAEDVVVPGGSGVAGVETRIAFGILDLEAATVEPDAGTVELFVAQRGGDPAIGPFPARWESLVAPDATQAAPPAAGVVVARLTIPEAGGYLVGARYRVGGAPRTALGTLQVDAESAAPAIGAQAPRSETPTLRSATADASALTTANPPDRSLLRDSVAESLAQHVPFVVTFATPALCQSRICGPTVDIVLAAQRALADTDVRFIHVEVFTDNDPTKGYNRFMGEWGLRTEPWTFVVGGDGRVAASFQGPVGLDELVEAARAVAAG